MGIEFDRVPLVVGIDSEGNDIFDDVSLQSKTTIQIRYSNNQRNALRSYRIKGHPMKLAIDETRCKGCNLCTKVCPYKIFKEGKKPNRKG